MKNFKKYYFLILLRRLKIVIINVYKHYKKLIKINIKLENIIINYLKTHSNTLESINYKQFRKIIKKL